MYRVGYPCRPRPCTHDERGGDRIAPSPFRSSPCGEEHAPSAGRPLCQCVREGVFQRAICGSDRKCCRAKTKAGPTGGTSGEGSFQDPPEEVPEGNLRRRLLSRSLLQGYYCLTGEAARPTESSDSPARAWRRRPGRGFGSWCSRPSCWPCRCPECGSRRPACSPLPRRCP